MMPPAQAVESLIHEYGKLVFQTIYGLTGDWEESQDLTQDTFHQALKTIDAARAKSGAQFHAKAWLLQIALNTVRMQRRRRSIFRFIPFSRLQKEEVSDSESSSQQAGIDALNERVAPVQPAGYGAVEGVDLEVFVAEQDAVRRSLARLTEPLRLCLLLSVVGQFSTREIAQMLEIEEAAVRQRLGRARKQFQVFYEHESGEEILETSETTTTTNMSQNPLPNHRSNIERAELRFSD
jgi:RNA polymerase sigma-70 factor (ECF subfamily)